MDYVAGEPMKGFRTSVGVIRQVLIRALGSTWTSPSSTRSTDVWTDAEVKHWVYLSASLAKCSAACLRCQLFANILLIAPFSRCPSG